jgi:hypothetical protein
MVRRGSTVRVRQRAFREDEVAANRHFVVAEADTVEHLPSTEEVERHSERQWAAQTLVSSGLITGRQAAATSGDRFWGRNRPGVLPDTATLIAFSRRGRGGVPECGSLGSGAVVRLAFRHPTSGPAVGREPQQARSIGTHDPDRMRAPRRGTSEGNPGPIRRPIGRDVLGSLRRVSQPLLPAAVGVHHEGLASRRRPGQADAREHT